MTDRLETVFGSYTTSSRGRLDLTYDYETAAIFSFKKILSEIGASCLLDVGANIGVYSIFCSDIPALRHVHAFEPAPAAYDLLKLNIALQPNRALFTAHRIAASSKRGLVSFKIVSPLSGANAVIEGPSAGADLVTVKAATVDSLIDLKGQRIGIKIDVEGHEASAIEGMKTLLVSNECFLQVESLRRERSDDVGRLLHSYGYRYLFSLRDDHLFIHCGLASHTERMLKILSDEMASDLRDLMHLRREKRTIALAARKLRELSGYRMDPLFLPQGKDPFA